MRGVLLGEITRRKTRKQHVYIYTKKRRERRKRRERKERKETKIRKRRKHANKNEENPNTRRKLKNK